MDGEFTLTIAGNLREADDLEFLNKLLRLQAKRNKGWIHFVGEGTEVTEPAVGSTEGE